MEKEHIGAKFDTDSPKHEGGDHLHHDLHVIEEKAREKLTIAQRGFANTIPIHKLHLHGKPKEKGSARKQSAHFAFGAQAWKERDAEMSTEVDYHRHAMEVLSRQDRGADDMIEDGIGHLDKMNTIRRAQEQSEEKEAFLADTDTEEEGKQETPAGDAAEGNGTPRARASSKRSPKKAKLLARSPSGVAKRPAGKPKAKRCVR